MKYLIYSDVHGNLPAFEKILEDAGTCDGYICLGDLVNYGPWSNECVDLALSLPNSTCLLGNHETMFITGKCPNKILVKQFFDKLFPLFTKKKKLLYEFFEEKRLRINNFIFTHTIDNKYIYPDTDIILDNNYMIGHSHIQFKIENNNHVLYNTGSVGQNRKYINVANYLVWDDINNNVEMKQTSFDIDIIIDKMIELKYPIECIKYYKQKEKL